MAHGYLSYQDTRGEAFFLGDVIKAVKKYLDQREEKEKVADMIATKVEILNDKPALPSAAETPLLKGGSSKELAGSPLQKMLGGTVLQRSLPGGAAAVNPEVMGGGLARSSAFNARPLRPEGFASDAIVNIGATDLGVERDLPGDDMFVKRMGPVDNDQGEVVQAIDRLTFVTMSLVQATKEQTNSQKQIAAAQQQQAEQLARNAKASAEENFLEKGADFSSNIAYERSMLAAGTGMIGRRGGGGGPGMGIGGKIMAKRMLSAAGRRGAGRMGTRLGAALGGKMLGGLGKKAGAKLGGKAIGKVAGGAIAKSLGKKIPLVGLGLGAVFAAQRAMQGDFLGAGLELASGAASTVPGIGTAGSIGIDAALAARDMTMMADGGIVDGATNAIIGEDGREGVFPLEGPRGKKTFIQFGEGILEAQKRNKKEFAKIQAEGLSEYYDKRNGWTKFIDFLKGLLPWVDNPDFNILNPSTWSKKTGTTEDDDDRAGSYKIDPSKFAKGVYGTGLVTGPEGQIGVGTEYHLDSKFSKDMSMEDRVKLMDQLARGYAARGREIEFSNDAVAGTIYDPNATMEEKMALLKRVQDAHSHSLHADYDSIDYYIPNIGKGRGHESAEGAEILMPTMEGAQLQYGQGGGWGASVTMVDENGKVLMKTGHGDIRGAKTGTVDLSPPEETTTTTGSEEPKPTGNWASKLQHFGFNHSYIDFGPDNKYRAIKMDNGYVIHKKGFIQRRVSTDDGANMWLMNSLLEAGNARVKSATTTPNLDPMGDQGSLSPEDDGSNALSATSTEVALADTAASGTTVINNYTTVAGNTGNGSSTVGNQVPFGSGVGDMGGDVYSNTRIRTLVG